MRYETEHTPIPWYVGEASDNGQFIINDENDVVAEAYPDNNQDFEANARVIAQAGELLDVAQEIMECARWTYDHGGGWIIPSASGTMGRLRDAIERAILGKTIADDCASLLSGLPD